ncbi:RNI-like protein [Hypoxylon fragiforme]|uniref:RNI-like protein n=1 Tax=Hypoxylon fragiforme TaxID=63214 RepID=UPI0020C5C28F|nr:RNI-like protein [Hypoxylon fragiforme]KAI2604203.1 RNI-like protein [Hypoxylon fragiforme]
MRRNRASHSPPSSYRALAHHPANGLPADSVSLIRSFNSETNPTRPIRPSPLAASTIPDMPLDLLDRMRSFPLFMSAPEEFLVAIGKHLRPQVHSAHDHILTEGDEAKAMYWLVRGVVGVTSRDGEAVYAELKPGAFFGEIGVLMDMPRTATIVARTKCLLLVLKKEDLQLELPKFPDMEKAIREEAHERLNILNQKRRESGQSLKISKHGLAAAREVVPGEVSTGEIGVIKERSTVNTKKRKSPSPGSVEDPAVGSALGSGLVHVRQTLRELPLFSTLPPDILHFLGMSAQPKTYPPFTDIIRQGTAGNEIFFIVRGEAEVIHEPPEGQPQKRITRSVIRPRLKQGQYFGEVVNMGLSLRRTATVRSITAVECLMINGEALEELWRRCSPDIRKQVEDTAKTRIKSKDEDVEMADVDLVESDTSAPSTPTTRPTPQVIFTTPSKPASPVMDESDQMGPKDPDPYLSVDMENLRNRRRGSLAPPTPPLTESPGSPTNGSRLRKIDTSLAVKFPVVSISPDSEVPKKKTKILSSRTLPTQEPLLPDDILVMIFQFLDVAELIRLRLLSSHMRKLLTTSPKICTHVNLSLYNRRVTNEALINVIAPFLGPRPIEIDISNCFHITDEGFQALWRVCGRNIKIWKMKSVWDVSANQILDMSENAKGLEEVDWSNCRKVGDNLLARVVGWVIPESAPSNPKQVVISSSAATAARLRAQQKPHTQTIVLPPPGTVVGCPKLRRLNLSYCKHITDRSMAHMAAHASNRLESLSLTRCTSITDAGFQSWAPFRFTNLTRLCLADCTYLSDNAIVALVHAAKWLTHLDLSFCCALSDTATEVVALGLPQLRELKMAFCGSAVSDNSLACIALHLNDLERISVRGCVRVEASGIESVLEGCGNLVWADVSQCRNLEGWIRNGGVTRWGYDERVFNDDDDDDASVDSGPTSQYCSSPIAVGVVSPPPSSSRRSSVRSDRARAGVAFVVEKGAGGLR